MHEFRRHTGSAPAGSRRSTRPHPARYVRHDRPREAHLRHAAGHRLTGPPSPTRSPVRGNASTVHRRYPVPRGRPCRRPVRSFPRPARSLRHRRHRRRPHAVRRHDRRYLRPGNPASGDTVAVTPQVCTSIVGAGNVAAASLAVTITNAAPSASPIVTKDQTDAQFSAGAFVGHSRKSIPLSSVVNDCCLAWKGADSLTAHPGEQAIALLLTLPAVLWRMQGSVALSPRARPTIMVVATSW